MWVVVALVVGWCGGTVVPHATTLDRVSAQYARFVSRARPHAVSRVAVGWNACADVIVSASALLSAPSLASVSHFPPPSDAPSLDGPLAFAAALRHFFLLGKAAERFVANATFFSLLSEDAVRLGRVALGGNAALMARGMSERGEARDVLLGGVVRELTKPLLPEAVTVVGPAGVHDDQLHVIVEWGVGDVLFGTPATRANRFIVSRDLANARLLAAEPFLIRLQSWKPALVVLSGLHMLDGVPERSERRQLLRSVRNHTQRFHQLQPDVPIHYEWASIGEKTLARDILHFIGDHVDSMGFNEEETRAVYFALVRENSTLSPEAFSHSPKVGDVETALAAILARLPRVSRLHFHSLGLHMSAVRKGSRWRSEKAAVLTGSITTSLRVCNTTRIDPELFELRMAESFVTAGDVVLTFGPGQQWEDAHNSYSAAPVLVCKRPTHTVGAGDSISSSALVRAMKSVSA